MAALFAAAGGSTSARTSGAKPPRAKFIGFDEGGHAWLGHAWLGHDDVVMSEIVKLLVPVGP